MVESVFGIVWILPLEMALGDGGAENGIFTVQPLSASVG